MEDNRLKKILKEIEEILLKLLKKDEEIVEKFFHRLKKENIEFLKKIELSNKLEKLIQLKYEIDKFLYTKDTFLTFILDLAIESTNSERGFIIIGKNKKIIYGRNFDKEWIDNPLDKIPHKIIELSIIKKKTLIYPSYNISIISEEEYKSIKDLGIKSIICSPFKLRKLEGVFYLDNRFCTNAFDLSDLSFIDILNVYLSLGLNLYYLQNLVEVYSFYSNIDNEIIYEIAEEILLYENYNFYINNNEKNIEKEKKIKKTILKTHKIFNKDKQKEKNTEQKNQNKNEIKKKENKRENSENQEWIKLDKDYSNIEIIPGIYKFGELITQDEKFKEIFKIAKKIAPTSHNVLIIGESGTGKELLAKAIHKYSKREKFLVENFSSLPQNLIESELFGYIKGAFSGADKEKIGLLRLADKGTLFLDEISDMSLGLQQKLLRILETKKIRPLGSNKWYPIDIRIISCTNKNIEKLIKEGKFREDLWYRLSTICFKIPPLRERKGDIPLLIKLFLLNLRESINKKVFSIEPQALDILMNYDWQGNVRELRKEIIKIILLKEDNTFTIKKEDISSYIIKEKQLLDIPIGLSLKKAVQKFEYNYIIKTLNKIGNKTNTAKVLQISRKTLYNKIEKISNSLDKED